LSERMRVCECRQRAAAADAAGAEADAQAPAAAAAASAYRPLLVLPLAASRPALDACLIALFAVRVAMRHMAAPRSTGWLCGGVEWLLVCAALRCATGPEKRKRKNRQKQKNEETKQTEKQEHADAQRQRVRECGRAAAQQREGGGVAALLPQLPSLTDFDFLRGLPNLTLLRCSSCGGDEDLDGVELADQLVAGLRHCTNITRLRLNNILELTSARLSDLLPRLPQLGELELSDLDIDSLSFLAQPPLTGQLSSLTLSSCKNLPLAELRHLHSLRGLRELSLHYSFNERMEADCDCLTALRLPSAALPLLESFTFGARDFEAESVFEAWS